jgi:hypothetical protein
MAEPTETQNTLAAVYKLAWNWMHESTLPEEALAGIRAAVGTSQGTRADFLEEENERLRKIAADLTKEIADWRQGRKP